MKILMFSTHSIKYIWYSPQKSKYPLCIIEFFPNCKGSNFDIHIWVQLLGFNHNLVTELISSLSRANVCVFHENRDRTLSTLK